MFVDYKKYINSNEWKKIRIELLILRDCKCQRCDRKYNPRFLHVHHLTYKRLGNEEPEDLEVLCAGCHSVEHGIKTKYNPPKKKKPHLKIKPKKKKVKKKNKPNKTSIDLRWEKMRSKFGFGNV